jgi:hypothetical protein
MRDCFVAVVPRNDSAILLSVIASPGARDKLHEAISGAKASPEIAAVGCSFFDLKIFWT